MRWCIFYDDRPPYSSEDGGPETAPARGVQVIVQDSKLHGPVLETGGDYYGWNNGRWQGYDIIGLWDYLCMPGWKVVLFGRMVTQAEYNAIIREAGIVKEIWLPHERKTT